MTKIDQPLAELFLATSRGAARKAIYALRARQDGETALAALYQAMGESEAAQARRFLVQLRGRTGRGEDDRATCFGRETPALIERYQAAAKAAEEAGEKALHSAFSQSERVEKIFLALEKKLAQGKPGGQYQVCRFCGFIKEGTEAPEHCPICTAPAGRFQEVGGKG